MTQSTASRLAEDFGQQTLPIVKVVKARTLMTYGLSLHEAAHSLGVRSRDLDLALWESLCRYGRAG